MSQWNPFPEYLLDRTGAQILVVHGGAVYKRPHRNQGKFDLSSAF
jgi:hypothetical protein